jgi:hypothetical protein
MMHAETVVVLVTLIFNGLGLVGVFHRLGRLEAHFASIEKRLDKLEGKNHVAKISGATA